MRYLDQDASAIDQDRLTSAESFPHQEQIGLRDVMGFYRQTSPHAFVQLLPPRVCSITLQAMPC
jgi:hypothetical protein